MAQISPIPPHPNVKASCWYADLANDFPAENIDSKLFTHLLCAFADIDSGTSKVTISDKNLTNFSQFTDIVQGKNIHVQTLMSIGGKNAENNVALMAAKAENRKIFIDSSIDLARSNGFYGLDLSWMYPKNGVEMNNFGKLLEEWQKAIQDEAGKEKKVPLLLTATVYYSPDYHSHSYPVKAIAENLDWVNLMSYDFYEPGSSAVTRPPAALYDPSNASGLSGDSGVSQWLHAKLPAKKIVLGFPYYGWAWTLKDAKKNGYDAPTDGPAISVDGSISYEEIRNYIVDNGAATFYDPTVIGHYCYVGTTWIGYDDNQSIVSKVKYTKQKGLLGYFSWHVGADFNCGLSRAASVAWDTTEVTTGE